MGMLVRRLIFGITVLISTSGDAAESVAVKFYGVQQGAFSSEVVQQVSQQLLLARHDDAAGASKARRQVYVALGMKGLKLAVTEAGSGTPIVALLPSIPKSSEFDDNVVFLLSAEQPINRYLALAQLTVGSRGTVGLIAGPAFANRVAGIQRYADNHGMRLNIQVVSKESEVGNSVQTLINSGVQSLLSLPDGTVNNSNTTGPTLLLAYRSNIPVIAFSDSYLKAGAAIAMFSSPSQLAKQLVEMIVAAANGNDQAKVQYPRYFSIDSNTPVLRSMGLGSLNEQSLINQLSQIRD